MKFKKPKFWDYQGISFWSILLFPISIIYLVTTLIIKTFENCKKSPIPIICVGNIYLGGTGKTPLVKKIFNITKSLGKNPAFIKKYYDYLLDEISMLNKIGKVFQCIKREEGIFLAFENKHDVAILDDGYQDFSIKPNFSVLCFNSKQLLGNGFIIPSGPLRESLNAVLRAHCIVINGDKNLEFERKLRKNIKGKVLPIFYSKYKIKNKEKFQNKEIVAFAGIGNPSNFFNLLKEYNLNVKKSYSFPDHHNYTQKDFNKITEDKSAIFVTTEKDYYRIPDEQKKKFAYVELSLEIENEDDFKNLIMKSI